jgi:ribosomal protein S20
VILDNEHRATKEHEMRKWIAGAAVVVALVGAGGSVAAAASPAPARPAASSQTTPLSQAKGRHKGVRRTILRGAIKVSAQTIGIPPKELAADLKAGQSVADVAAAHNVDKQKVIDALVTAADKRIDTALSKGKINQQRADRLKARVPAAAAKFVDHHRTTK